MKSINPTSGETIKEYEKMSDKELESIIEQACSAQESWAGESFRYRAGLLKKVAASLRAQKKELAELMAGEMGKPLAQGVSEAEKCAWVCEYYSENAEDFLADELIDSDATKSYIHYQPLGTVLAIMPWNFPFWQLFRFAAPALMAGNAAVLKHAPNVTGCALKIEDLIHRAGIPHTLFRTVVADVEQTQSLIVNPGIAAVTLTGSTGAGRAVAEKAGSVLKKTVLELGGSDPYIILDDADLDKAAETCVTSRLINSGQSCIAAKRLVVVEKVYDAFLDKVTGLMKNKTVGDPFDDDTDIGPMARVDLRDKLHEQVQKSIEKGAKCMLGGEKPGGEGAFYPATVLSEVSKGMPAYNEELFGPVISILKVSDQAEAIQVANDTDYGLGAAVFSKDVQKAEKIASEKLEAGCTFVNAFVKSDPRLPFGGIKQSGYGRELSKEGIKEFVNVKTVYVD